MMTGTYWSTETLLFYIFLALIGMGCMSFIKSYPKNKSLLYSPHAIMWWTIWVFFAVFRVVKPGIGGADAIDYIDYYVHCNDSSLVDIVQLHNDSDLLFKWINKIFRFLTPDYHLFFLLVYGLMVAIYISFLHKFSSKKYSVVPFILVFFLYLRGYSSIRSNLSASLILMGLISLIKEKKYVPYVYFACSVLIHKMAFVFALVLPFCHILKGRMIKFKYILLFLVIGGGFAFILRPYFVQFAMVVDLGGSYKSYVEGAMDNGHFAFINDLGQMALAVFLWLYQKRITMEIGDDDMKKMLWNICALDIAFVPVNQLLGIYRGYEFYYLARLCMWSLLMYIILHKQHKCIRVIGSLLAFTVFLAWMIFRIRRTYEDTSLMPYLFDFDFFV